MNLSRRSLITGLVSFVAAPAIVRAAPAIVRASSIMPVKAWADRLLIQGMLGEWQGVTFVDLEYDEKLCAAMARGINGLIPGPGWIGDYEALSNAQS